MSALSTGNNKERTNELPAAGCHTRMLPFVVAKEHVGHSRATVRLIGFTATSRALSSPSKSAAVTLGGSRIALAEAASARSPNVGGIIVGENQRKKGMGIGGRVGKRC
jgi:hypothetical protein